MASDTSSANHGDEYLLSALESVRGRLLDKTRRNRLLNYKESGRDIAIIDEMPDQVHQHLVIDGKSFLLDPYEDEGEKGDEAPSRVLPHSRGSSEGVASRYRDDHLQTPFGEKELDRRLRRLYREHRTIIQETGANNLYIAAGFLRWKEREEESLVQRSPLILIPVRIVREGRAGAARYRVAFDDEALDTNYSLSEKLRHGFDLGLPKLDEEQSPEEYWAEVEQAIEPQRAMGWCVEREMAIGMFRFQKQVMWHDLAPARWPSHAPIVDKPLIRRILLGPKADDAQPGQLTDEYPQDELADSDVPSLPLIRDADSSQYSALVDALDRQDGLVIEGPPGTGKSQTITNLIAAAMSQGKSVLFVAEKMAALGVVYDRLEEAGLGDFCLQLHGLSTGKKELLESTVARMDRRAPSPGSLSKQRMLLAGARQDLIKLSTSLTEVAGPEQLPLHEMTWRAEKLRQRLPEGLPAVEVDSPEELSFEAFEHRRNLLADLGRGWEAIPRDAREAWLGFSPEAFGESDEPSLVELLRSGAQAVSGFLGWLTESGLVEVSPGLTQIARVRALTAQPAEVLLPPFPEGGKLDIIHRIAMDNSADSFRVLLDELDVYMKMVDCVNQVFDFAGDLAGEYADRLSRHVGDLSGVALDPVTLIGSLPAEFDEFQAVLDGLESLSDLAAPVLELVGNFARTLEDYEALATQASELGSGPKGLLLEAEPLHATSAAPACFDRARDQFAELTQQSSRLVDFELDRTKDTESLRSAAQVVSTKVGAWFPIFSSKYRSARATIRGAMKNPNSFSRRPEFVTEMDALVGYCEQRDLFGEDRDLQGILGRKFVGIETDWDGLGAMIQFSRGLAEDLGPEKARSLLADWPGHVDRMEAAESKLLAALRGARRFAEAHPFPERLWARPVGEIAGNLAPWRVRVAEARDVLCAPWCSAAASLEGGRGAAEAYRDAIRTEVQLSELRNFDSLLAPHWRRQETEVADLSRTWDWLSTILSSEAVDIGLLTKLVPDPNELDVTLFESLVREGRRLSDSLDAQAGRLKEWGALDTEVWLGGVGADLVGLQENIERCEATVSAVPLMARWQRIKQEVIDTGLERIPDALVAGELPPPGCAQLFEYSVYSKILGNLVEADPVLSGFAHERVEALRERFAELDRSVLDITSKEVAAKLCRASVPAGTGYGPIGSYTERRLIEHEAGKKSRHIPIRQLVRRAGNALQALKPCFLMSPLSVAQFLAPGEIEFDLVVMDEASQIRPEDALGAIARGRKVIVVGDPKQLPPTSFFDTAVAENEDAEETIVDDTESILDVCLKQIPYRRLRWHYRSQHEDLIRFSNEQFYDNDLIVFPSPKGDSRDYGVHSNFVEAPSYASGRNREEARAVVARIVEHYKHSPDKSLGVAAFNRRQAEEIELLLDRVRAEDPALDQVIAEADPGLFIKNLENVQGDERDVIYISTTYGPQKAGDDRMAQRFGPINSDSGWRRLNVIATRAKQRVEVITSMRPHHVILGDRAKRGVRSLRSYLEYAETGRVLDHGRVTHRPADSEFEEAVGEIVRMLGYDVEPQVGVEKFFIDLGVRHPDRPGEYLMGIECDGAAYHSSRSIRDRDRLRQTILEDKGWFIHRIWSTSWFHTRSAEIDRLKRAIESRLEEDRRVVPVSTSVASDAEEIADEVAEAMEAIASESEEETLEAALERFWKENIAEQFADRERSILSGEIVGRLVRHKPESKEQWFSAVPMRIRQDIEPRELTFLEDVLDLIAEYG